MVLDLFSVCLLSFSLRCDTFTHLQYMESLCECLMKDKMLKNVECRTLWNQPHIKIQMGWKRIMALLTLHFAVQCVDAVTANKWFLKLSKTSAPADRQCGPLFMRKLIQLSQVWRVPYPNCLFQLFLEMLDPIQMTRRLRRPPVFIL